MKTNLSRSNKLSNLLLATRNDNLIHSAEIRLSTLGRFFKRAATESITINSWEDLEEEFEDYGSEIRDLWESYVDDFDLDPLRTKDIKSFLDFYNKRGLDLLPEDAQLEEEKLLPQVKDLLIEFKNSRQTEEESNPTTTTSISKGKAAGVFGDTSPNWLPNGGFANGPQQHQKRHGKDPKYDSWSSNNAWDLCAPAGTVVHSLTKGKVGAVKPAPSGAYNIFGTHVSINGLDGYPSIFYTHVENVLVKPGDIVEVGTPIAQITTPPQPPPDKDGKERKSTMPHHVHIGIEGAHISTLISANGKFKLRSSSNKAPKTFV